MLSAMDARSRRRWTRSARLGAALLCAVLLSAWADAPKSIDTTKSTLTVRVFKAGLFSALGHDHQIQAPIQQGSFRMNPPVVDLLVDARRLRVADPDISDKDRAQVQETMLGPKVLDADKFPEIRFHASELQPAGADRWLLPGQLSLHGQQHPVTVNVELQAGHYRGSSTLNQKNFGITPVSVGGGAVKVKDEVRIEFDVVTQ